MNTTHYCQCRFVRKGPNVEIHTLGYIPSWSAKVGNKIQILSVDGEFWEVISVGEPREADLVRDAERNYMEFQVIRRRD